MVNFGVSTKRGLAVLGILLFFSASLLFAGGSTETQANPSASKQPLPDPTVPSGWTSLATAYGDLMGDQEGELVVVYDTGTETDFGTEREIRIFGQKGQTWDLLHKSRGAVLPSQHGGVMGDPFVGIEVSQGLLTIEHFGGSSHKWAYVHTYTNENGSFILRSATINTFQYPFYDYQYSFQTSTGEIKALITNLDEEKSNIDDEKSWVFLEDSWGAVQKLAAPILMDGFYPGNNEIKIEDGKEFWF